MYNQVLPAVLPPNCFTSAASLELLPDQAIELFGQHCPDDFTHFPLFGSLPEELRMMIWRAAFRRNRTVQVELSPHFEILHSHTPSPMTLRINRESRAETLRFYIPLVDPCPRKSIYFHPSLDSIYFHRRHGSSALGFMLETGYVTSSSISGISKIKHLMIPKMYYGGLLQGFIKFGRQRRLPFEGHHYLPADRGGLRFFRGLETLILVGDRRVPWDQPWYRFDSQSPPPPPPEMVLGLNTPERCDEYVHLFQKFFEWERETTPDCKIPGVVVEKNRNPKEDRWYLGRLSEIMLQ